MATNTWLELPIDTTGGGGGGVTSFNGRTGAVLPLAGDYTASQITNVPAGNITAINVQNALNQLDSIKQATITGGASSITTANLTINRALISDGAGKVAVSPTTAAELAFVSGVTSSIQTQLNAKGSGTVTSVALTDGIVFSVSGSPITTSGTLALNLLTQAAHAVLIGPTSGGPATPTFRSLVASDLTTLVVPVANGGTGLSTTPTNGQILIGNGTNYTLGTITAGPGIAVVNGAGTITVTNSTPGVGTLSPGFVGNGVDGDVVISVNTTLVRDMNYNSLTVNAGVTLTTAGFTIFSKTFISVAATGFIVRNGNVGGNSATTAAGAAGAALSGGTTGSSGAGGAGGAGTITNGGSGVASGAISGEGGSGGVGGNGGVGSSGTGGSGGNSGALSLRFFSNVQPNWKYTLVGTYMPTGVGGAGGAAGGGDGVNLGRGGGGGASAGGGILLIADSLNNLGTIQAKGGAGGNGGAGALGNVGGGAGGGGGGGGMIMVMVNTLTSRGTLDVSGGAGGLGSAGAGTGGAGTNGAPGSAGFATSYEASTNTWITTS